MSQDAPSERQEFGMTRVGKRAWGYDVDQVDAFLSHAHELYDTPDDQGHTLSQDDIDNAAFNMCKNGYAIDQVDAALQRLSRAIVDRQTAYTIGSHGFNAWLEQTNQMYDALKTIADREAKQRFARAERGAFAYDCKQVDTLVNEAMATLTRLKSQVEQSVEALDRTAARDHIAKIHKTLFTQRKGKRGYSERHVDFYCSVLLYLLNRFESVRAYHESNPEVSLYPGAQAAQNVQNAQNTQRSASASSGSLASLSSAGVSAGTLPLNQQPAATVPSLFEGLDQDQPERHSSLAASLDVADSAQGFQAVQEAEQAIFAGQEPAPSVLPPFTSSEPRDAERATASDPLAQTQQFDPIRDAAGPSVEHYGASPEPSFQPSYQWPYEAAAQTPAAAPEDASTARMKPEQLFESANDSLAALAQMAQDLRESSAATTNAFELKMPSLQTPSVGSTPSDAGLQPDAHASAPGQTAESAGSVDETGQSEPVL